MQQDNLGVHFLLLMDLIGADNFNSVSLADRVVQFIHACLLSFVQFLLLAHLDENSKLFVDLLGDYFVLDQVADLFRVRHEEQAN